MSGLDYGIYYIVYSMQHAVVIVLIGPNVMMMMMARTKERVTDQSKRARASSIAIVDLATNGADLYPPGVLSFVCRFVQSFFDMHTKYAPTATQILKTLNNCFWSSFVIPIIQSTFNPHNRVHETV